MEYRIPEAKTGWAPHGELICSLPDCGWRCWKLCRCTVRLKKGVAWLIPIVQDVTQEISQSIGAGVSPPCMTPKESCFPLYTWAISGKSAGWRNQRWSAELPVSIITCPPTVSIAYKLALITAVRADAIWDPPKK